MDMAQPCVLADFLPESPTSPITAARLMSGGSVPAQLRVRTLPGFIRCGQGISVQLAGELCADRPHDVAGIEETIISFNTRWPRTLQLLNRDCSTYANALISYLAAPGL
jgi:hypothetical protein